jgi:tape measure domain-containing protein
MTTTIDNRLVQIAFQNDQFEKGVGTSLQSIDKLKKGLNFSESERSLSGLSKAASNFSLAGISNGVENISNRFSALGVIGMTVLMNLTNAALNMGKSVFNALVIDPIKTGLNEYETKMNSIQTILANTSTKGTTLDQVNEALDLLNTYADKTIYNFAQMTRNVGTFTAAGIELDTATSAIKGIANLAAVSGSNADQASTAMYQLSQALSSGSVKLMDWNSVVNAGMGGQVFQDAIKETARTHGVAIDEMIKTEGSFRETLREGWFTAEILTETLSKFTGDLTEDQLRSMGYTDEQIAANIKLGQMANDAATKVKTFTQLWSTLKEAAQSGWARTWQVVIGDFEEAKILMTEINDIIGALIGSSAEARNSILEGWKELGGRTAVIDALRNAFNGIMDVLKPITEALKEIFPPVTSQQLFDLSMGIKDLTEKFKMGEESAAKLKRIFKGVFAILDIGKMVIVSLAKGLEVLLKSLRPAAGDFADLLVKSGDWIVNLRDFLKSTGALTTFFINIAKVLSSVITGITVFFGALVKGFSFSDKAVKSNSMSNFLTELAEKFKSFGKIGLLISKIFGIVSKIAEKFGPLVKSVTSKIGELFDSLLDAMTRGLDKLDSGKILTAFNAVFSGGVFLAIKKFLTNSSGLIGSGMFAGILASIKDFIDSGGSVFKNASKILDSVKGSLDAYQKSLKSNTLMKIAQAIALLVLSIVALTLIDQGKLVNATAAVAGMFVALTTTLEVFDKTTGSGKKMLVLTAALIGISLALVILSGAVLILSKLDPKEAAQGVIAIASILGVLVLFQKLSSGPKGLVGATAGLLSLSTAMLGLNLAVRSFGGMDMETLGRGLLGMSIALGIVSVAMKNMNAGATGAGSMFIAAGAILVLGLALKTIGSMSIEQVSIALLAIAGALTILGIAGSILTPVAPTIAIVAISLLAIGAAALAVGLAIGAVGAGLASLALGIVALAGLGSVGIAALTLVISGLAALIPLVATQIAKGITAFLLQLYKSIPEITLALVGMALELLKGFSKVIPEAVETILTMIESLLTSLKDHIPSFVESGYKLLIGILTGIRDNIGEAAILGYDIAVKFLAALSEKIPDLIDSGFKFIIAFIDGLSLAIEENLPVIMASTSKLSLAIMKGLLQGWIDMAANVRKGIVDVAKMIVKAFKDALGIHSPSDVFIDLAKNIILGIVNGFKQFMHLATDAAVEMAKAILSKVKDIFDIKSPSKETMSIAKYVVLGLANGISKFSSLAEKSANTMAQDTLGSMTNVMSRISDIVNSDMNVTPTVTPILDMSEVLKGNSMMDKMMSGKTLNLTAAYNKLGNITSSVEPNTGQIQNPSKPSTPTSVIFNQNNYSPKELSRLDIYRQTQVQLKQLKRLGGSS